MEENELDLVVFEDEAGNEVTMQVVDYLFYEGKEYALLTEYVEGAGESDIHEAFAMEVRPVEGDDENEEFVEIEDDRIYQAVVDLFQNTDFEEIDEEEDE